MDYLKLNHLVSTRITLRHFDGEGRLLSEQVGHNSFTYSAADVLVAALLRSGPSQITHLYCRYGDQNGTYQGILAPAGNDLRNTQRGDFILNSGGLDTRGGLWVPLTIPASVTSSASQYQGNQVSLSFRIPGTIPVGQFGGASFNPSGVQTSWIGGIGLAVAPNYDNDRTADIIFSAAPYTNFSPANMFQVPPSGQTEVGYTFSLTS